MEKFCLVRILSMPFGVQMDGPHAKCSSYDTFLYIVAMHQFCITQCLECLPPKECIPERFQDFLQAHYSESIPLSAPAAAARPLWPQSTNETVEDWPVRFCALPQCILGRKITTAWLLLTKALRPDKTNLFNQQEPLLNSNQGAPAQDLVGSIFGYAVAHDQDSDSDITSSLQHWGNVLRPRCPKGALVSLCPTFCRRCLHDWNPAPAS